MMGDPLDRNPSTSRGPLPPTQTVAPKFSRSAPDRVCEVKMPHDGSGTRSGKTDFGGSGRYGTRGRAAGPAWPRRAGAAAQQPRALTTVTCTVWVAPSGNVKQPHVAGGDRL